MSKKDINANKKVEPMIYAYTIPALYKPSEPEIKVGYTEKDTDERIAEQFGQTKAVVKPHKEWDGPAIFDDNGEPFKDHALHSYFAKNNIERLPKSEWFKTDAITSKRLYNEFKKNHGILEKLDTLDYKLREEQEQAVKQTVEYYNNQEKYTDKSTNGEYLWNAKPRFGKTLTAYDFCKKVNAKSILILTNRPAIAASWYSDYEKFIGTKDGYYFVSSVDTLKDSSKFPLVLKREDFSHKQSHRDKDEEPLKHIDFISLQDLKGGRIFGGDYDKLDYVDDIEWDVVILDEAHEGVDTFKTDYALDKIKRKFTLYLSGTPFKAIRDEKFEEDAIFNWTYVDEQTKKRDWAKTHPEENNPYGDMPSLNLFTYQMSSIVEDKVNRGIDIDGETQSFAFDLNEFFATNKEGNRFVHDKEVDKFLDALTSQTKFPFSTEKLRNELKHTFWLLNRVSSAKCLAEKLKKHSVFKDYEIIIAAGDGKDLPKDENEENEDKYDEKKNSAALNRVKDAINHFDKTITLSVGQLTTGITVPEWTAVLMLSNMSSESLYVQAAFRAQNPCLFKDKDGNYYRKKNAYVFDFDPARTLTIYESFAKSTASDSTETTAKRNAYVKELLNFLPVIGEDDEGEMIELDAEKVLSIPRKIHAQEVIKHGFMSNFLFKNISNVFLNPALLGIASKIPQAKEISTKKTDIDEKKFSELKCDENGEPIVEEEKIVGLYKDNFGDKIYEYTEIANELVDELDVDQDNEKRKKEKEQIAKNIKDTLQAEIFEKSDYLNSEGIPNRKQEELKRIIEANINKAIDESYCNYNRDTAIIDKTYEEIFKNTSSEEDINFCKENMKKDKEEAREKLKEAVKESVKKVYEDTGKQIIEIIEKKKKKDEIKSAENSIKDHLRGFSRTIPSFLMAYGDNNTTLDNFDKIVSEEVFEEVTRNITTNECLTLDEFRLLRDGGIYIDKKTSEEHKLEEGVFDEKVFDSSIKEFMNKRIELADYFDESKKEDIFDYIPPQKTNQIFTPKIVVKDMLERLENENPGCFDNPNFTFFDPYMKSGQYITEIIKRLYRSEEIKKIYPDDKERLLHIFENQVYGCAPTEIIFAISLNYIVGFINSKSDLKIDLSEIKHNFLLLDTLPLATDGKMNEEIFKAFNDLSNRVDLKNYVKILYETDAYEDLK